MRHRSVLRTRSALEDVGIFTHVFYELLKKTSGDDTHHHLIDTHLSNNSRLCPQRNRTNGLWRSEPYRQGSYRFQATQGSNEPGWGSAFQALQEHLPAPHPLACPRTRKLTDRHSSSASEASQVFRNIWGLVPRCRRSSCELAPSSVSQAALDLDPSSRRSSCG